VVTLLRVEAALVLWDIDHTLVEVGAVSREIYALAFEQVTGRPLVEIADMTGRTEQAILIDTLALHGISVTRYDEFYAALGDAAASLTDRMRAVGRRLPGAKETIAALVRAGVVQSVVTGNIRTIATTKLAAFGLVDGIDLDAGGYGSDDGERPRLVRLARRRAAQKYGVAFPWPRTVVIGDTPLDVQAAQHTGAHSIGVATGASTVDDLAAAGADLVVADLTQADKVSDAVIGLLHSG
jgi:phosphoglycolate phosphatase-like HAD superfamily hydrolase